MARALCSQTPLRSNEAISLAEETGCRQCPRKSDATVACRRTWLSEIDQPDAIVACWTAGQQYLSQN